MASLSSSGQCLFVGTEVNVFSSSSSSSVVRLAKGCVLEHITNDGVIIFDMSTSLYI